MSEQAPSLGERARLGSWGDASDIRCVKLAGPPKPRVSVLVRVKDELMGIRAFWAAMERQTIFWQAEILFLDGGSTDGTLEFLGEQSCALYSLLGQFNFGRSCNQIASKATSLNLVFLSAHVLLEQTDALERMVEAIEAHPEAAIYVRQVPNTILGYNHYDVAYCARRFPAGDHLIRHEVPLGFSNAASGMRRNFWEVHPFREVEGAEDFLWAQEQLARGGEIFYMPQRSVMHSHSETAEQVHRRVRRSVVTRQETRSYCKAIYMVLGVYVSMRRIGAGHSEALRFAWAHGSAYL